MVLFSNEIFYNSVKSWGHSTAKYCAFLGGGVVLVLSCFYLCKCNCLCHVIAKYSEYKSSWPPEPIGHSKSWKTNRNSSQPSRPPPGLTNQKQSLASPWPTGGPRLARGWGAGSSQETRFESGNSLQNTTTVLHSVSMFDA